MQKKFICKIIDNKVVVVSADQWERELAEISYERKVTFSSVSLDQDVIEDIKQFARYDNVCSFLQRPHEKELKPVAYKIEQWKAVTDIIRKLTYGQVWVYEYDINSGDIYITCNRFMCRKLCSFLSQNGIRNSLQTDGENYCTVIYSNLINQINQLNEQLRNMNETVSNYQTIKVTFNRPLAEVDQIFDNPRVWGVASLKQWIESYESSRFTQIGSQEAIITSEYNMEHIKEWLLKQDIIKSSEDIN